MQLPRGEASSFQWSAGKLNDLRAREDSADQVSGLRFDSLCHTYSSIVPPHKTLIVQGLHRLSRTDSLFYMDVTTDCGHVLRALVDSGSMACTISEMAETKLLHSIPNIEKKSAEDFVIVGCGGHLVTPSAIYELTASVYGYKVIIPVLVVPGQTDQIKSTLFV